MGLSGEKREAAEFPRLRLNPSQPWGVVLALGVALPNRSPAPQEHPGAQEVLDLGSESWLTRLSGLRLAFQECSHVHSEGGCDGRGNNPHPSIH